MLSLPQEWNQYLQKSPPSNNGQFLNPRGTYVVFSDLPGSIAGSSTAMRPLWHLWSKPPPFPLFTGQPKLNWPLTNSRRLYLQRQCWPCQISPNHSHWRPMLQEWGWELSSHSKATPSPSSASPSPSSFCVPRLTYESFVPSLRLCANGVNTCWAAVLPFSPTTVA